jgi:hypothetical protein
VQIARAEAATQTPDPETVAAMRQNFMDTYPDDFFPDNETLDDPTVSEALSALMTVAQLGSRWGGLEPTSRKAHQKILKEYMANGSPPAVADFSAKTLADLECRDLVHVRHGEIALAYPFSTRPTELRMEVEGVLIHAVCAVDALGTAAMTRRPVVVNCVCPICGTDVSIRVLQDGLTVKHVTGANPRVWIGVTPVGACSADTQCKSLLMFCCSEHLESWRQSQQASARNFDLSLAQATQLGSAIFRSFLIVPAQGG